MLRTKKYKIRGLNLRDWSPTRCHCAMDPAHMRISTLAWAIAIKFSRSCTIKAVLSVCGWVVASGVAVGFDHINRNAPVLIRTPKLTQFEPA